jgi:hypothetical protein
MRVHRAVFRAVGPPLVAALDICGGALNIPTGMAPPEVAWSKGKVTKCPWSDGMLAREEGAIDPAKRVRRATAGCE